MRSSVRRRCAWLLGISAITPAAPRELHGQRDAISVVVLAGNASTASRELLDGFRRRFQQLGRAAEVLVVETEGEGAGRGAATRNVGASTDLILALGSRASALALSGNRTVPVIGALLARESVLAEGSLAASFVLEFGPEVELEWMRRILPKARRIGVLFSTDENARLVRRAQEVAKGLGMEIIARRVVSPAEIPAALAALASDADVLWGIADDVVLTPATAKAVLLASLRSRVPFVGLSSQWVRAGAVYALDRDYGDLGAQMADIAIRLRDGVAARPIGAVRPRKVRYSLNARSAEMMRLTMPPELLRGATEVYR
jgi:putative tryptophan/tyrosine transport system substrate-binding protein